VRRYDGTYAIWYCMSFGDLDMIPTREIKRAIEANEPHRNPLRWAIVACTIDRDTARMVERELRDTDLRQFLRHHPEVGSSLRGWTITGDFGSRETPPSPTET
jgi:exoribonuclease II